MSDRSDAAATRPLPRVALVMVAVGDLGGSGGAERQYCDVFEHFRRLGESRVTLITARVSLRRLRDARRLADASGVIALPLGDAPARGWLNVGVLTVLLTLVSLWKRFDVVHLCLPTPSYVPFAAILTRLPRVARPRVALSVIDCTLAHTLAGRPPTDLYEQQVLAAHRLYFRWVRLEGIYTWYRAFVDTCRAKTLVPDTTLLRAARFCFTDPDRFRPDAVKEPIVIFAGRLSEQKRPWLFVEAIAILRQRWPALIDGWRFAMYGSGVLEPRLRTLIAERALDDVITMTSAPDLAPVFARTRLFVSTQAFENFTSLAMLEAMAAGNAVIAEDVGQTREFVRDRENGLLVSPATPETFAVAMAEYLRRPDWHDGMARASRTLATDVHTIQNFGDDIARFWRDVAAGP